MTGGGRTDLAVLEAFRLPGPARHSGSPFAARHGFVLIGTLVLAVFIGDAQAGPGTPSIPATILKWTPLLPTGFALNIAMSVLAMAIGTVLGMALGLGLISLARPARAMSWLVTQFFRNAPWLVLLFYCVLRIGGVIVPLPGWAFAREVADEIYFTDRGVVVEHGPPAEFFTKCRDERTRRFLSQIL
jgi:polar amino acid transport system permease protein